VQAGEAATTPTISEQEPVAIGIMPTFISMRSSHFGDEPGILAVADEVIGSLPDVALQRHSSRAVQCPVPIPFRTSARRPLVSHNDPKRTWNPRLIWRKVLARKAAY